MSDTAGRPATRAGRGRILDAAALLLLVSGAAVYVYVQYRTSRIAEGDMPFASVDGAAGGWNVDAVDRLARMSRVAAGLAIAGVVAGLAGFLQHILGRPRAPHHEQADDPRSS